MPQSYLNFGQLVGTLTNRRPGLNQNVAKSILNERMRQIIDRWTEWSGLRKNIVQPIPQSYVTGGINMTTGSKTVIGVNANWPVDDVVNTTINELVQGNDTMWVTPASMDGITLDTVLYVDAAGPDPEVLPVKDILGPRILLTFRYAHASNFTATASSLNGQQIRPDGYNTPIFTIISVKDPETLVTDQPWGRQSITNSGYRIVLMYITIDPQCKYIIDASDPFQQIPLRLQVPQSELNKCDPNRTATNSPVWISPRGPNVNGNFLYEIWPPQYNVYQLNFFIQLEYKEMRIPTDYPPTGINPNMLIYGGLADAYATPCPMGPEGKDRGFSLEASAKYAQMFEVAFIDALNGDQASSQSMWTWDVGRTALGGSMGANYAVDHLYDSNGGYLGF